MDKYDGLVVEVAMRHVRSMVDVFNGAHVDASLTDDFRASRVFFNHLGEPEQPTSYVYLGFEQVA